MKELHSTAGMSRRRFLSLSMLAACGGAVAAPAKKKEEDNASVICIDAETCRVLFSQNADLPRPEASLVKLMQLLLVAEGLEAGKWTLDQAIPVSAKAQGMGGTQVLLAQGETWPLGHLMHAVAVASANDAAMAVAEGLWGGEAEYLKAMNVRAAELGMKNTVYHSVHGLPPDKGEEPDQTTASDMALLGQNCVRHAQILDWTSTKEFQFRPGGAKFFNTNKLLWRLNDCDGLKTGYIRAAGFCVVATAKRDNQRLISVVLGSVSKYGRFNVAEKAIEDGFQVLAKIKANTVSEDAFPVLEGATSPGWRLELHNGVAGWKGLDTPNAG